MTATDRRGPPGWVWLVMIGGLFLVYVFGFQSEYVIHEKAEGETCDEWMSQGRDVPSECDEGFFGSFTDILVGDTSIKP